MKLHDLRPRRGAHQPRTRVGRGIAAGKGKTAGRGTKGQKARAGGSIPAWFEGGQTPLQIRIPKLRGFKNRFRVEYEVVNVGRHRGPRRDRRRSRPGDDARRRRPPKPAQAGPDHGQPGDPARGRAWSGPLDKPLKVLGQRRRRPAALRRGRRVQPERRRQDRGGRRHRPGARAAERAAGRAAVVDRPASPPDGRRSAGRGGARAEPRRPLPAAKPARAGQAGRGHEGRRAKAAKAAKAAPAPKPAPAAEAARPAPSRPPDPRTQPARTPERARVPAQRLPRAGHPAADPLRRRAS